MAHTLTCGHEAIDLNVDPVAVRDYDRECNRVVSWQTACDSCIDGFLHPLLLSDDASINLWLSEGK